MHFELSNIVNRALRGVLRRPTFFSFGLAAPHAGVLHEIFERQADAAPDGVAVVFGAERATYADLERRANRLARHLRIGVLQGTTHGPFAG